MQKLHIYTYTQTKIKYNKISQSIGKGREAPSVMPKHLHFVQDPRKQRRVARRIAKDKRARIQFITKLKGLSHLILRKSHKQWMKNLLLFLISHQQKHIKE